MLTVLQNNPTSNRNEFIMRTINDGRIISSASEKKDIFDYDLHVICFRR